MMQRKYKLLYGKLDAVKEYFLACILTCIACMKVKKVENNTMIGLYYLWIKLYINDIIISQSKEISKKLQGIIIQIDLF